MVYARRKASVTQEAPKAAESKTSRHKPVNLDKRVPEATIKVFAISDLFLPISTATQDTKKDLRFPLRSFLAF
jgi:hypothetical protein